MLEVWGCMLLPLAYKPGMEAAKEVLEADPYPVRWVLEANAQEVCSGKTPDGKTELAA